MAIAACRARERKYAKLQHSPGVILRQAVGGDGVHAPPGEDQIEV